MFDKRLLGIRLRDLRQLNNLTQGEVAAKVGCLQSSLSNIERGIKPASFDIVIELANYFGVSIDYLLGATDFPYPLSPKAMSIINQANSPDQIILAIQELTNFENQNKEDAPAAKESFIEGKYLVVEELDDLSISELKKYAEYLKVRQTLDKGDNESSAGLDINIR